MVHETRFFLLFLVDDGTQNWTKMTKLSGKLWYIFVLE
jgi:hypothetical protein